MGNLLCNAGGLDGAAGWDVSAGAVAAIDETVLGGPGRAVIKASDTLASGEALDLASNGGVGGYPTVTAGELLDAFAGFASLNLSGLALVVEVLHPSTLASLATVPVPVQRPYIAGARRGLAHSFGAAGGRLAAPATGKARLRLSGVAAASGPAWSALLKPFLGRAPATSAMSLWDPGVMDNVDLQLPRWPAEMPRFQVDSSVEPIPNRDEFVGDQGIPSGARQYDGLRHSFRGRLRLDLDQADRLDAFYETANDRFFLVRPDTDQLCIARWLKDGAPKPTLARAPWKLVEVGLHLAVA